VLQSAEDSTAPIQEAESASTRRAPARGHIYCEARRDSMREQRSEHGAAAQRARARAIASAIALASAVTTLLRRHQWRRDAHDGEEKRREAPRVREDDSLVACVCPGLELGTDAARNCGGGNGTGAATAGNENDER
jgi:hypothetical protein